MTLVRKSCFGCGRHRGFGLWRWSGSIVVTSHGLCHRCVERLAPACPATGAGGAVGC